MPIEDFPPPDRMRLAEWESTLNQRVRDSDIPFLGLHEALFTEEISRGMGSAASKHRSAST